LLLQKKIVMIKFNELKVGDYVMANNDGDLLEGEITNLNNDEKQACVDTGAQGFWYSPDQLNAIPLDAAQMEKLKFTKQQSDDGMQKFSKGAFRVVANQDLSRLEIWYRDEKRQIMEPTSVHTLQNHFYEMTKIHLNTDDL
jgi:hypothetical protein